MVLASSWRPLDGESPLEMDGTPDTQDTAKTT